MTASDDLSKLTAAGNTTALPGWTISPFRLADHAQAGREFAGEYLLAVGRAADKLPDRIAGLLLDRATSDVAGGRLAYGNPEYDVWLQLPESLPLLLWLSLRAQRPDLRRDQAEALLTPENERAVRRAVLESAGFDFTRRPNPPPTDAGVPPNWKEIFAALGERGIPPEAASRMTVAQMLNALGRDAAEDQPLAPDESAAKRRAAAGRVFEEVMRVGGVTRGALAAMELDTLAAAVKAANPALLVEPSRLAAARDEYLAAPAQA